MFSITSCAQIAAVTQANDSTYSTTALREMIDAASRANRQPPPALQSYRSHIETEVSLLIRDTLGRENTAEVEQLATTASWSRDGRYDLHVIGYRSQSVGVPYSALSIVRAWTVPSLYGERLSLGAYFRGTRPSSDTVVSVHPLAADRARFYRFEGGDTIAVLRVGARRIPIIRIRVHPNIRESTPLAVLDGEIDLDADRLQIIRMRGQFVIAGAASTRREAILRKTVVAVAYVEFVNAEIGEKYWLPTFQRTEFQAGFPLFGSSRPILRLVSTISRVVVNDTCGVDSTSSDSLRVRLTWASGDSINAYKDWQYEIGAQSGSVHADDFDDVGPDVWRSTGPPRFNLFPNTTSRILRFNRIEGLFTGVAPSIDFRNVAPGLSAGINAGWAWTENTARGGAFVSFRQASTTLGVRAERELASTNDFAPPLSEDPGVGALLTSTDDYDYVDRRSAMVSATRLLGSLEVGLLTVQAGVADDRAERARLAYGLFHGSDSFRQNRGVVEGRYALAQADVELHPDVSGDFVRPGLGLRAHYEAASGDLRWQRAELGLSARRYLGPISLSAHADGGVILGAAPPPQRLFELGGSELLPGYAYKQFAGDRAALLRSFVSYRAGVWQRPVHLWRNFFVPGVSPGVAISAQGGWTEVSSAGALRSVQQLGTTSSGTPVSEETHGIRATLGGGLTFFSDLLHVGLARPVDHAAPWKLVVGFGASF
jgi:hypothetical protein